jgi:hypothetical protein
MRGHVRAPAGFRMVLDERALLRTKRTIRTNCALSCHLIAAQVASYGIQMNDEKEKTEMLF